MSRSIKLIVATGITALLLWLGLRSREPQFWQPGPLASSESFGDYEVKIYQKEEDSLSDKILNRLPAFISHVSYRVPGLREWAGVEILRNHRRVYCDYGTDFSFAKVGSNTVAGLDVTGDGTPKVALNQSRGRQGGGSIIVFECGVSFRKISEIDSLGTYPKLRDLDGDGIPELVVSDDAFYHWPICRDGEPIPEVILRWRNGKYVAAKDLMYKPAPTKEAIEATVAAIRASTDWDAESCQAPPALWTNAIALMYSGHERLGWELVESAWKPWFPYKKELVESYLLGRLEDSVYARDIVVRFKTSGSLP